jgi:hypothetical protein
MIIYVEAINKNKQIKDNSGTNYPYEDNRLCADRINLPDGCYNGIHTGYFITLDNGVTLKTIWGVKGKNIPVSVDIKNGLVYQADKVSSLNKYVFIKLGEEGIAITLSDNLDKFKDFNHYGIIPSLKDLETLKRDGVVGWTGNDTWYYIMQHDTWRYMNLDLRIDVIKSAIQEMTKKNKN